MARCVGLLMAWLVVLGGCGPTAQQRYDAAVRDLERAEARLDNLRPAFDAARKIAANAVCREIAGTTPEESATAALQGLGDVLTQAAAAPADANAPAAGGEKAKGRRGDELDRTIDNLIAAQQDAQAKQAALAGPLAKAHEVMAKINTPGTPEAKRVEEKLAAMREAEAYLRQEKRVEKAQLAVDEAQAALK